MYGKWPDHHARGDGRAFVSTLHISSYLANVRRTPCECSGIAPCVRQFLSYSTTAGARVPSQASNETEYPIKFYEL